MSDNDIHDRDVQMLQQSDGMSSCMFTMSLSLCVNVVSLCHPSVIMYICMYVTMCVSD